MLYTFQCDYGYVPRLETQESSVCSVDASGFGSSPSIARTTIAKGSKIVHL